MSYFPAALTQLVRAALGRGHDNALTGDAPLRSLIHGDASPDLRHPASESSRDGDAPDDPFTDLDPGLVSILGEKVLHGWLRNRYQLLFPFALDLRRLDDRQAE